MQHGNSRVRPLGGSCQSRRRASHDVAMLEGADPDIASLIRGAAGSRRYGRCGGRVLQVRDFERTYGRRGADFYEDAAIPDVGGELV
jgi:hypothetical protein